MGIGLLIAVRGQWHQRDPGVVGPDVPGGREEVLKLAGRGLPAANQQDDCLGVVFQMLGDPVQSLIIVRKAGAAAGREHELLA